MITGPFVIGISKTKIDYGNFVFDLIANLIIDRDQKQQKHLLGDAYTSSFYVSRRLIMMCSSVPLNFFIAEYIQTYKFFAPPAKNFELALKTPRLMSALDLVARFVKTLI